MCMAKTDESGRRHLKILDEFIQREGVQHISQEVIDSLIAVRASYEPTCRGALDVLRRTYDLKTSRYNLLYHRDQDSSMPLTCGYMDKQQTLVIVRSSKGGIFVACRGTFDLSDVVQDVKVSKAAVPFVPKGRAHVGFLERAQCFSLDIFLWLLRTGEKLIFTGHSMGGAVSSLLAIRVLEALAAVPGHSKISRERVKCITFGSAPFANLELSNYVNFRYRGCFYNLVSKHDFVPRLHNIIPNFLLPVAKKVVDAMTSRWEVQVANRLLECIAGMPLEKALRRLGDRFKFLRPITSMFRFTLDCAAADEQTVCFGQCGYLVLLDLQAQEAQKVIRVNPMEELSQDLNMGNKSVIDLVREHGLANYYECLVRNLSSTADQFLAHKMAISPSCGSNILPSTHVRRASIRDYLCNPKKILLMHLSTIMIQATGNDFKASEKFA